METKKRYKKPERGYVTPKMARKAADLGLDLPESEYEEIEVVEVEGPEGPVRLTTDVVENYQEVWAEAAAAEVVDGVEEESE